MAKSTHLPLVWSRFKSQCRRWMWDEFVGGSLIFSERFFSGYSSPQKPTFPNFNSTRVQVEEDVLPLNRCLFIKSFYLFIYLFNL